MADPSPEFTNKDLIEIIENGLQRVANFLEGMSITQEERNQFTIDSKRITLTNAVCHLRRLNIDMELKEK